MNGIASLGNALVVHAASGIGSIMRRRYIAEGKSSLKHSTRLLLKLVKQNKDTEFGRAHDFASITSVKDYQERVPLTTYDDYRDYIERTAMNGEQNLMTSHTINYFAQTSGTVYEAKLIPQVAAAYIPFLKFMFITANDLVKAMRARGVSSLAARGMLLTEIVPKSSSFDSSVESNTSVGVISSYFTEGLRLLLPLFTPIPGVVYGSGEIDDMKYIKARYSIADRDLKWIGGVFMSSLVDIMAYIEDNHDLLIHDIETGTIDPSISMSASMRQTLESKLKPNPERAKELREVFNTPSVTPLVMRIWPNMSFVCSIGTADFEPHSNKMRTFCADDVQFGYALYASSEVLIGIPMRTNDPSYLLQSKAGFFEFMPLEEECEHMPKRPLLLNELEVGKHYEIIVTNLAGLYRYQLKDVVLVTGYEGQTPYLRFAFRQNQVTNISSVHLTGEQLSTAVMTLASNIGTRALDFCIYSDVDRSPGRIELFLETEDQIDEEQRRDISTQFDKILQDTALNYGYHRVPNEVGEAVVYLLKSGTFARYRDKKVAAGASLNQLKTARVINDEATRTFFLEARQEL